ncbi:PREDICTED: uncharacterized protein LOC106740540 isoform X4 [Dinoponera quadriceps]|uniref:Uncharacterized protein LOC106740540 isoform X4 n=1 Tax=Dinoponera quadriceps TaxID=609295 RepID=A0A6P3WMX1_DINQU|nr:PREDICTED: uncharacterized protein LOC106740540 isoform X4 [Dinoponera quadriceps]
MVSFKSNPMDATWVKTNPTGETIEGCESVKQGAEMQQNVDEKADLFDVTSVKINPTGETIEEPAEQGAGKLQNAGKKTGDRRNGAVIPREITEGTRTTLA